YLTGALRQGKIGIGWSVIQKAMTEAPHSGERLTLLDVDRTVDAIAMAQGSGSTERRVGLLAGLFSRATPDERRFLSQLLIGEIRQGALDGLLVDAIAKASALSSAEVRQASMFSRTIGELARAALQEGRTGLDRFSLRLFAPVEPMLANGAKDVEEALDRLKEAAFEYKLDGARIQVHKVGDDVRIFTRQLQDITGRLPEIVEWAQALPAREAVLDGEAIALRADGRPLPFQITMRRLGRSKDVASLRHEIPVFPFMFDVLAADGQVLIAKPYEERNNVLAEIVPAGRVPSMVTASPDEARRFLAQSISAGHEGVMAKSLTASYTAGQRGFHWLKLKEATTLDLVILAAEWGSGRREGWLSNLHLGARDPESGRFIMLGKTFKGLTDEMLQWQTEKFLAIETHRDAQTVYMRPEMVAEIAFSDIQESPRYPAGFALRFARVKRYRVDKSADQADTIQTVAALFGRQRA
ncbi:MAG TPA: ATP-dependent DNA ligase, partial [Nitrospira sp.]